MHHSDRGVQYASAAYRQRLAAAGVQPSMSREGNCYDNAAMESFWGGLKRESVHRVHFATRAEARAAVFEWIEIFYNREPVPQRPRLPITRGLRNPTQLESPCLDALTRRLSNNSGQGHDVYYLSITR